MSEAPGTCMIRTKTYMIRTFVTACAHAWSCDCIYLASKGQMVPRHLPISSYKGQLFDGQHVF